MNHLDHLADFQAVLQNYQPSDTAKTLLQQIPLVLMVGPTSSGRNTIINELLKTDDYHYIVSDTTRQRRTNNGVMEQDGREYWFRSEADMLQDLQNGLFLEAAVIHNQQVSGISIRELARAKDDNKIAVNEIEVVGADHIFAAKPDTRFLFILPPSFDEWMVRITARGQLPEDEMQRRLESAVDEISVALERDYYHFFVNNTFKQTTRAIDEFIKTGVQPEALQAEGLAVARQLLADTKQHLGR